MLFNKKDMFDKLNQQSVMIGYDLGEYNSQISFCTLLGEEPQTLSSVAGEEQFDIPTVLCKRLEVNQWFYGKEALKAALEKEGVLIDRLVSRARNGEKVVVEEGEFDPVELLTLFIKRSFSMMAIITKQSNIGAVMITVDTLDKRMIEVLAEVVKGLPVQEGKIFFQSHEESAFHYIMHQPQELWNYETAICDFSGNFLKTYRMELNKKTIPIVALIESKDYEKMRGQNDNQLLEVVMELCQDHIINSIFLIGDKFQGEWCKASLNYLCRSRRVFQGSNLYSKGSCYAIREKAVPTDIGKGYVFLGKDKLKSNIGMKVMREGKEVYQVLLNAGENWYDAKKELDVIIEAGNVISIIITSLNERESKIADIALSGLPMRPQRTTRIHMEIKLWSEDRLRIFLSDMGFGEIFISSGLEWEEEFQLV